MKKMITRRNFLTQGKKSFRARMQEKAKKANAELEKEKAELAKEKAAKKKKK